MQRAGSTCVVCKTRGFTLLELLAGIAVLGILLGLGVPSFRDLLANNRLTAMSNEMVTAIAVARGEARKRGIPVSICAANTAGNGCVTGGSWNSGWLVFTDDVGTAGVIDAGDELLQIFTAPVAGFAVTSTSPTTLSYVRFQRNGAPDAGNATRLIKLTRPACTGMNAREISVANTGRVGSAKIAC